MIPCTRTPLVPLGWLLTPGDAEEVFVRGDVDGDGTINITDWIKLLGSLFLGDPAPDCLDAADADDSGVLNITDAIVGLAYNFQGGTAPSPPSPTTAAWTSDGKEECSDDPTDDGPDCETFSECP